jgi:circadian clock protein KaiC
MQKTAKTHTFPAKFPKSPTGIQGLDDITKGGLPKNRPTLIAGNPGCGKTVMAIEFIVNGIVMLDEPGVFMSFEEKSDELKLNVSSLGYDLDAFTAKKKIHLDYIQMDPENFRAAGKYDIEGLFARLGNAIDKIKAKRVVLDSLDTLFSGLDAQTLRWEFKRLFSWLKDKKVTAIITAETSPPLLTRMGVEEYVADCVILLDNRVTNQIATRRLRIIKYRGSLHGNSEYPFVIEKNGITVFPLISEEQELKPSTKRISSGIGALDEMLGNKGFYVGSSILISGTAGTGKTSVAASFALSVCKEKHRCLFCAFEEAPNQVMRNVRSIGLDLRPMIKEGRLAFYYARPTLQNLELHFLAIKKIISEMKPSIVVLDPITNLMTEGPNSDVRSMLTRFVDYLKTQNITVLFTAAITVGSIARNPSDEGISSMVDTWIMVQDVELEDTRTRSLYVMKSRGMAHSKEVREFVFSPKGVTLSPINTKKIVSHTGGKTSKKGKLSPSKSSTAE